MQYADIAKTLAAKGRNGDSVLVHMTPGEVGGLQALAQSQGGSLTVNPDTGMPEAFSLKSLLPTLLGAGLSLIPGVGPLMAAGIVGGGTTLATGSLEKGLMAGLGAFGGASLGGTLNATGAAASGASNAATTSLPSIGAAAQPTVMTPSLANLGAPAVGELGGLNAMGAAAQPTAMAPSLANLNAPAFGETLSTIGGAPMPPIASTPSLSNMSAGLSDLTTKGGLGRFGSTFYNTAGGGLGTAAAAMGVASPIMEAMQPEFKLPELGEKSNYKGPYVPTEREVRYPTDRDISDSSEFLYFTPTNPVPGFRTMASGGEVKRFQGGGMVTNSGLMQAGGSGWRELNSGPRSGFNLDGTPFGPGVPAPQPIRQPLPVRLPQAAANPVTQRGLQIQQMGMQMMPPAGVAAPRNSPLQAMLAAGYRPGFSQGSPRREAIHGFRPMQNIAPYIPSAPLASSALGARIGGQLLGEGDYPGVGARPAWRQPTPMIGGQFLDTSGGGMAKGGLASLNAFNQGGMAQSRFLQGPGDGTSDSIPANIGGTQPARLADGEFVVDARTVSELGNGSSKAGAKKLYAMMDRVHNARKKAKRGQNSNAERHLPA
jgi:hypothetical protein